MSPVSRLKKTWSKVKTAKFFILEVKKKKGAATLLKLFSGFFLFVNFHIFIQV